ncbi:hypothetical protein HY745_12415 [Candidatus Desantisbacteria bacterium]|nr:hypothetical protein [Candidatus Desantisbacteria bacterium]
MFNKIFGLILIFLSLNIYIIANDKIPINENNSILSSGYTFEDVKNLKKRLNKSRNINSPKIIHFTTPKHNVITDNAFQAVSGIVEDPSIENIILIVNKNSRNIPVKNGCFSAGIELMYGKNTIKVIAQDKQKNISVDKIEIIYKTNKPGPKVLIEYPSKNETIDVSNSLITSLKGTIDDLNISNGKLMINNIPFNIKIKNGNINTKIVLFSKISNLQVQVINAEGIIGVSDTITIKTSEIKKYDAIIILSWDTSFIDLDLVLNFGSEKKQSISSKNPNGLSGAKIQSENNDGDGLEVITLNDASP